MQASTAQQPVSGLLCEEVKTDTTFFEKASFLGLMGGVSYELCNKAILQVGQPKMMILLGADRPAASTIRNTAFLSLGPKTLVKYMIAHHAQIDVPSSDVIQLPCWRWSFGTTL